MEVSYNPSSATSSSVASDKLHKVSEHQVSPLKGVDYDHCFTVWGQTSEDSKCTKCALSKSHLPVFLIMSIAVKFYKQIEYFQALA